MSATKHARALRGQPTWAEKLMWSWLRNRRFSAYKFRRGHPVGVYFLDFYCREACLAIELDGGGHGYPGQIEQDAEWTRFLAAQGIHVLRFWNSQLRPNSQAIQDTIFREWQSRAPHPLPDYTRPMSVAEKDEKNEPWRIGTKP